MFWKAIFKAQFTQFDYERERERESDSVDIEIA